MQNPILSKSSNFLERWSAAEFVNARLGAVLMVMTFSFISLSLALVYVMTRPRPVYYVPGVSVPGVAYPQSSSKLTASMFATSWVLDWSNFTPASIEEVYKRAQRFMAPGLLNKTRLRLKKDIEKVKNDNMSSLFSLSIDPQVEDDAHGFKVIIHGDKAVYVGKDQVKQLKVVFKIYLRVSPPTDFNPYGLIIEDINQEVIGDK